VIEPEELRTHVREEATSVIANLDETPAL
jgi:hypothetical protein